MTKILYYYRILKKLSDICINTAWIILIVICKVVKVGVIVEDEDVN
jgi:hypothetical protein